MRTLEIKLLTESMCPLHTVLSCTPKLSLTYSVPPCPSKALGKTLSLRNWETRVLPSSSWLGSTRVDPNPTLDESPDLFPGPLSLKDQEIQELQGLSGGNNMNIFEGMPLFFKVLKWAWKSMFRY